MKKSNLIKICPVLSRKQDNKCYKYFQTMQSDPNFGNTFRAQALRFVLPLRPKRTGNTDENLVKWKQSEAEAYYLKNGEIIVKPEIICNSCELPRINYDYLAEPYRYFYAMDCDVETEKTGSVSIILEIVENACNNHHRQQFSNRLTIQLQVLSVAV